MMNGPEPWLVTQLRRLAQRHPEQFEALENHLRISQPNVYEELAIMAVEHGEMTSADCAVCLQTDEDHVGHRLEIYRRHASESGEGILITTDAQGVARLANTHVTVWEIVREFRRVGSVASLKEAFASLTESELRAALVYAGRHPDEIGEKIREYEEFVQRTKAAYPFA